MHFVITLVGTISVTDEHERVAQNSAELLEAHLDAVMNEFLKINVMDPDIDLDLENHRVKFAVLVESDNPDSAIAQASPLVRSAIHGAGGSTPDWPDSNHNAWSVGQTTLSVQATELLPA